MFYAEVNSSKSVKHSKMVSDSSAIYSILEDIFDILEDYLNILLFAIHFYVHARVTLRIYSCSSIVTICLAICVGRQYIPTIIFIIHQHRFSEKSVNSSLRLFRSSRNYYYSNLFHVFLLKLCLCCTTFISEISTPSNEKS